MSENRNDEAQGGGRIGDLPASDSELSTEERGGGARGGGQPTPEATQPSPDGGAAQPSPEATQPSPGDWIPLPNEGQPSPGGDALRAPQAPPDPEDPEG